MTAKEKVILLRHSARIETDKPTNVTRYRVVDNEQILSDYKYWETDAWKAALCWLIASDNKGFNF